MICNYLTSETTIAQFVSKLLAKHPRKRIPFWGSIELTARCNCNCSHCYINKPAASSCSDDELTYKEICDIVDQLVQSNCIMVLLTGGEALLRNDFFDIYDYFKRSGILVSLYTNGTTITPEVADYLGKYRPKLVDITLYGHTKETFEKITRTPASYEKCHTGIELLLSRNIPLRLKTVALRSNYHEIPEMKSFAENLGLPFRYDTILNQRLDGGRISNQELLTPKEIVEIERKDKAKTKGFKRLADEFIGPPPDPDKVFNCGAGNSQFHIDPYGKLYPCMLARGQAYDLRNGSFLKGWNTFIPEVRNQRVSKKSPCNTCEINILCGQCPGFATLEHGDNETMVEYLCEIGHLRLRSLRADVQGPFHKKYIKN